jgi:hypothetical protein
MRTRLVLVAEKSSVGERHDVVLCELAASGLPGWGGRADGGGRGCARDRDEHARAYGQDELRHVSLLVNSYGTEYARGPVSVFIARSHALHRTDPACAA